jgi:hypothetical protein
VRATSTIEPFDQVDISSELSGTMRSVRGDFNDVVPAQRASRLNPIEALRHE